MSKPTSRQELVDYCKRQLGYPVITINVDDSQVDDSVDDAIQFYQEYHSDAIIKHYRKHTVTSTDITNQYVDIPENIIFLSNILPFTASTKNMFSVQYQMHLNDLYGLRNPGNIINYEMTQQYMSLLRMTFDTSYAQSMRFNRHMNRVFIDVDWGNEIKENDILVFECFSTVNPEEYTDVYNDIFLKRYLTALIKKIWGNNTKKFSGMQLPGGVEINGQEIYNEAVEEIQRIEEEMSSRYSEPPMGCIG